MSPLCSKLCAASKMVRKSDIDCGVHVRIGGEWKHIQKTGCGFRGWAVLNGIGHGKAVFARLRSN